MRLRASLLTGAAMLLAAPAIAVAAPPAVTAPAAAVIETSTGTVVYAKNGNVQRGMASTTKLMTALVALDRAPLTTLLTAPAYQGQSAETRLGLRAGERMTVADLVRAMMLPSANDAAQTLALRLGGSVGGFVTLMNQRARAEGLTRTRFANPVGLDAPTHRTTAIELARIGVLAHDNPFLRATVKRKRLTLASGAQPRTIVNRNRVLGSRLSTGAVVDGMKTGHTTQSGYALVGSATRNGVTVVSAVLGDPSEAARDTDTVRLLKWASGLFQRRTLVRNGDPSVQLPVKSGKADQVRLRIGQTIQRVVPRGAKITVTPVKLPSELEAPILKGQKVGSARVLVGEQLVATVPLVAGAAVERESVLAAAVGTVGNHPFITLASLLLLGTGTLTVIRARRQGAGRRRPTRRAAAQRISSP